MRFVVFLEDPEGVREAPDQAFNEEASDEEKPCWLPAVCPWDMSRLVMRK